MTDFYLINGHKSSDPEDDFPRKLQHVIEENGIAFQSISSRDCIIDASHTTSVSIIFRSKPINHNQSNFFIRSYKGDAYFTYLLGLTLAHTNRLVSDEANLHSANSADKMTIMVNLALHELPIPRTILCTPHSYDINSKHIESTLSFPCVIKKTGAKGQQVWKVSSKAELEERLHSDSELTIIQEYLENDHDFRVFIYKDKLIGAVKRSTADGFYNNVSQGGTATAADISETEIQQCISATRLAKLNLGGVDFVRSNGEMYFFEVNKNPQLHLFSEALGYDLEDRIAQEVYKDTQQLS